MTYPSLKFNEAKLPEEAFDVLLTARRFGVTVEEAEGAVAALKQQRVFLSACGTYQVGVRRIEKTAGLPMAMLHLSIKRTDRQPLHDWRVLQAIKNAILSPEHEACEIYPAESRLVDAANQAHLWAFENPAARFPFGFQERAVRGDGVGGAVQRPIEEPS